MVFSSEDECAQITVTKSDVTVDLYPELISSQDECNTKVILYAGKILNNDLDTVISTPSLSWGHKHSNHHDRPSPQVGGSM